MLQFYMPALNQIWLLRIQKITLKLSDNTKALGKLHIFTEKTEKALLFLFKSLSFTISICNSNLQLNI